VDTPDRTDGEIECRDLLKKRHPEYADAKIEIWRQNQLCSFFSAFQPLAAEITGREHWRFQTIGAGRATTK
jgi:hypothetical protein